MKPFAESAFENAPPIHQVLARVFRDRREVLEVASGTGQHAVYMGARMPWLRWQPTDLVENLPGIIAWVDEAALPNVLEPVALDILRGPWDFAVDAVFSANSLHIVSRAGAEAFFRGAGAVLGEGGVLAVYGPFNYGGRFTSEGNERFDAWLKLRDPESGVRDFEWVDGLARAAGFVLQEDVAMPVNNRTLVWRMGP